MKLARQVIIPRKIKIYKTQQKNRYKTTTIGHQLSRHNGRKEWT